jgi:hypothetical protein
MGGARVEGAEVVGDEFTRQAGVSVFAQSEQGAS